MIRTIRPCAGRRAALVALALLWPAGPALAQDAAATIPSTAVPGTHDCASFYPELARRGNESGDVLISYDVGADGAISNVTVAKSSGHASLDRAAVACVSMAWRNTPAQSGGIAIASPGHQAIIRFALTEPPRAPAPTAVAEPAAPEVGSDLIPLLGLAGLAALVIAGVVLLVYRKRRQDKANPPALRAVDRDELH